MSEGRCLHLEVYNYHIQRNYSPRNYLMRHCHFIPHAALPYPQHWLRLLESGQDSDVTFVVKGERFKVHRLVLAARSAVFCAEKWTDSITVEDIETPVFKSMLYFIYSDSLPDFEANTAGDVGEKEDLRIEMYG